MARFGFMFDIDGVIVRGKKLLPGVRTAFSKLVDRNGKFRVPVVFATNAGNQLRQRKAEQLSEWTNLKVSIEELYISFKIYTFIRSE